MPFYMILNFISSVIFRHQKMVIAIFALLTLLLGYQASQIKLDAAFTKNIPLNHAYMQTYLQYQQDFGGANNILVSLCDKSGNIYNAAFFEQLKSVHDQLFFINGVDRSSVKSLYSPAVRFTQIVEDGFAGGPVIPADFVSDQQGLKEVARNVEMSGQVGRIVANDHACAMLSAQLMEFDPKTGQALDTITIANTLEQQIRQQYQSNAISIHIIGFTKMVGDVASAAKGVLAFFAVAMVITTLFVYAFCQSLKLTFFPIVCSFIAMIWKVGILSSIGFGIDPMSILLPFLIFAIGVSHGVQMINSVANAVFEGEKIKQAAIRTFKVLALPGFIALISDCIGFLTILSIDIGIIRELAISAAIGVCVIILTNLILLPVALSLLPERSLDKLMNKKKIRSAKAASTKQKLNWQVLHRLCERKIALIVTTTCFVLFAWAYWYSNDIKVGDLHAGAPALHTHSQYNQDTFLITQKYSVSVDILSVIAESTPDACTDYQTMRNIDDFQWHLSNIEGVQSSVSLTSVAKIINAGYNEGNPKWRVLASNQATLAQSVARVPTSSGLLNGDCSAMPIILFLTDHKADTIERVVNAIKASQAQYSNDKLTYRLASGPVGVMAATNEAVTEAQTPMMLYVYSAVILLCLISFRSIRATIAVVVPLYIVSILAQALMTYLAIGLTVYTLPVIALGVGIGVDYGIYILTTMKDYIKRGESIESAYIDALKERGSAVIFTGITLAVGVSTWLFSDLKFQVDMGILLTFMFLLNMLGAIILLPALVKLMWPKQ